MHLCRFCLIIALLTGILVGAATSRADGTFISAANRTDMVHCFGSDTVYITDGSSIDRYVVGTNTALTPITIDGGSAKLMGIDLSPDEKTLAVADNRTADGFIWIWLVDVATQAATKVSFTQSFSEGGTFSVAFGSDGTIFITSRFLGSGWVPFRRYDSVTNSTTIILPSINQDTMLCASGDSSIIGFTESNDSAGPVGRVRVSDGNIIHYDDYAGGTSWFNYEIGANHDGSQFAVPTYNGAYIYDGNVIKTGTIIGAYAGPQPMGVTYHPVENVVFFPWATTDYIYAFDTTSWTQIASYNFENYFDHPGNHAFTEGRLKMSRDGSILFGTVNGGVRFLPLYTGLAVSDSNGTLDENSSLNITLGGSIGNGGALSWSIDTQPAHGTITGNAPNITYSPNQDFTGTDSFTYRVKYGRAYRKATVSLTIKSTNSPPAANDDSATTTNGDPVTVDVIANDSDPDGDKLTVTTVTQGSKGVVTINADNTVTYTPQVAFTGTDTFSYEIDDGAGHTASAAVTITSTLNLPGLLSGVSISPATVAGGAQAKGTVKFSQTYALDVEVKLSSMNPAASTPATTRVTAGSLSSTFTVTTTSVSTNTTGSVIAKVGSDTKSAALTVRPVSVKSVTFHPSSVVGGHSATGTVTLEAPAGPSDVTVTLTSQSTLIHVTDGSGDAISSIVISAGMTTGTFTARTDPVDLQTSGKVRATANGLYKDGNLVIKPIPVSSIKLSPTSVHGGGTSTATITLLDPAAPGDITVALSSSMPGVAWFVDGSGGAITSVVVPAGKQSVSVSVQTSTVAGRTNVSLRAGAAGMTKSATLTVTP